MPARLVPTSAYSRHANRWIECTRCPLCRTRKHVCLARGRMPCDVLLIGEGPGESEDVLGRPFVGPAGQLLDRVVADALGDVRLCSVCRRGNRLVRFPSADNPYLCSDGHGEEDAEPLRVAFTNLVACIPRDPDGGGKAAEPSEESIRACAPRLAEFVKLSRPRLIVCVGRLAEDYLEPGYRHSVLPPALARSAKRIAVTHPAAVLRASVAQRGLMVRRMVVTIANAVEEVFGS